MATRTDRSLKVVGSEAIANPNPPSEFDAGLAALYAENGSVARAIMEWRHRVVVLYVAGVGAAGSYWLWSYDHRGASNLPLVLYALAIAGAILGVMDLRNTEILKSCYRVGDQIEQHVLQGSGGIYSALLRPHTFTYACILRVLFFGTSVVFFISGTTLRVIAIH
jgi:hypothetical protein